MTDLNCKQIQIFNVLINKAARKTLGFESYRWSNEKILSKCKWLNGIHTIVYSILLMIHKVNIYSEPKSIRNIIKYSESKRVNYLPILTEHKPKYSAMRNSPLQKGILLYNKLPLSLTILLVKDFKNEIKSYIKSKLPRDRINTYRDYL